MYVAVTEREVQVGMLQSADATNTSFCITRCITNLLQNVAHSRARQFIDTTPGGADVDVTAQQMLTTLRQDKITSVLGPDSIVHFDIDWKDPVNTNPSEDAAYLRQFMSVFEGKMLELIERAVTQQRSISCDSHVVEILQHLTVCRQRSQVHLSLPLCVCLSVCLSLSLSLSTTRHPNIP